VGDRRRQEARRWWQVEERRARRPRREGRQPTPPHTHTVTHTLSA